MVQKVRVKSYKIGNFYGNIMCFQMQSNKYILSDKIKGV